MLVCLSVNVLVYISFFVPVCVCTCVYLYLFISQNSSCQVGCLSYICHLSTYLSVCLSFSVLVWLSLCTYFFFLNFYLIVSVLCLFTCILSSPSMSLWQLADEFFHLTDLLVYKSLFFLFAIQITIFLYDERVEISSGLRIFV